jgi:acyl dehydratase
MLLYATICRVLGDQFPGAVQLEQELMFPNPTYAGEEVTVRLEVKDVQDENRVAWLDTIIMKADGSVACEGRTLIRLLENV